MPKSKWIAIGHGSMFSKVYTSAQKTNPPKSLPSASEHWLFGSRHVPLPLCQSFHSNIWVRLPKRRLGYSKTSIVFIKDYQRKKKNFISTKFSNYLSNLAMPCVSEECLQEVPSRPIKNHWAWPRHGQLPPVPTHLSMVVQFVVTQEASILR